jgi:hypothetical protein
VTDSLQTILTFVGGVLGAVLVYLGVRYSSNSSRRAAEKAARVNERNVAVEEWRGIVADLRIEVDRLRGDVDTLKRDRETDRALIEELRGERRLLLSYVREVLAWAHILAPGSIPPPAPAAFAEELL